MSKKPVIALTTEYYLDKNERSVGSNYPYIDAVIGAGGIPVLVPVSDTSFSYDELIERIDGLILIGGEDILPLYYNESPIRGIGEISVQRDRAEMELFRKTYEKKIPILGICRGMQLINVALGGSLYQDLPTQCKKSAEHVSTMTLEEGFHKIRLIKDSFLYTIFQKEELLVNSYHHQAVKELGRNLKVSAKSEDSVIEALESCDGYPLIATQFHPERMIYARKEIRKIFEHFIEMTNVFK